MNTDLPFRNRSTASTSSASTIRPRNRRLVSVDDDLSYRSGNNGSAQLDPTSQSPRPSRAVSPIPSRHPSRSVSANNSPQKSSVGTVRPLGGLSLGGGQATPTTFATGLWGTSWTSLQSIASNLLGNDTVRATKDNSYAGFKPSRRKYPCQTKHRRAVSSAPPTQWGPSVVGDKQIGVGSREERQALVKAKKRETLLAANGHAFPDSSGRFKRRVSDDRVSISAPPAEHEDRDALVYVHHVRPDDTLAGVMIKFNCQAAVFRKANRLWPNDTIQVRKTVVLPVEACGVKGRKVSEPEETTDFLGGDSMETFPPESSNVDVDGAWGNPIRPAPPPQSKESSAASIATSPSMSDEHHDDPPWKHDSWVIIDGHPAAVEIARLLRRTLGFFPRNRRNSNSYSDLDTPSASLELPRPPYSGNSPRRRKSRSSSGSYFAQHLQGPGGVGTLGRGASPGPAQDGLNKLFAPHLPNVAPRASFDSTTSTSSTGIENMGGAIEGWVRKLATKAATIIEPPPGGKSGVGDLIELSDAFDVGDEGVEVRATGGGDQIVGAGSARDDQERMLRERFPLRGRPIPEEVRRKKGD